MIAAQVRLRSAVKPWLLWSAVSCCIGGCSSLPPADSPRLVPPTAAAPMPTSTPDSDGPSPPDTEPHAEPSLPDSANEPDGVSGRRDEPVAREPAFRQRGLASWYGRKFHGRRTASGERFDMYAMTAAHPTLPLPSHVRVRNPANGAEVLLRINDRGPFHRSRIIDLSYAAALKLGVLHRVAPVELEQISLDELRSGARRRP